MHDFLIGTLDNARTAFTMGQQVVALDIDTPQGMTDIVDLFKDIISLIGVAACLFGILQIGMSISSHDASQRLQGFLALGGGVLIAAAPTIVESIVGS